MALPALGALAALADGGPRVVDVLLRMEVAPALVAALCALPDDDPPAATAVRDALVAVLRGASDSVGECCGLVADALEAAVAGGRGLPQRVACEALVGVLHGCPATTAALVHSVALRPVLHMLTGGFADVVHAAR